MIDLAQSHCEKWVSLKDISLRQQISPKYLEQIVKGLCEAKMIISSRGPQGGYKLARHPSEYTAGEILRAIEGELAPVACLDNKPNACERYKICNTIPFWEGLYNQINKYVDSYTLEELALKN